MLPKNPIALLHPDTTQDRFMHWHCDRVPGGANLHFADTVDPSKGLAGRRHYGSKNQGLFEDDLDNWIHLAVVYDADLKRVSHYRNGQVIGWKPIHQPRKLSIGIADIGNGPYRDWAKGTKFEVLHLIGRLDEFAVFSRALAGTELRKMYEVGSP